MKTFNDLDDGNITTQMYALSGNMFETEIESDSQLFPFTDFTVTTCVQAFKLPITDRKANDI